MSDHVIDAANSIHYEYREPSGDRPTFVFFNALSGNAGMWQAAITPALEKDGFGSLVWNYRGQQGSPIDAGIEITASQIAADGIAILDAVQPVRPVHVGMSIGGLFALNAHFAGRKPAGMLLINTLRTDGPRLRWVNAATHRAALTGGGRMLRDLMGPLIFGEPWQQANFSSMLDPTPYEPLDPGHNDARLLAAGGTADWNFAYEKVDVPVTVLTGLQDRVFYDEAVVAKLAARLPDAVRVNLPHAAHMVPVEAPDDVVAACRDLAGRIR